jgi:hypothetical protein
MNDLLQEGIAAVKAGDKDTGKRLLARVLQSDSHNEAAWLWLSCAVDEVTRKRECLERVLAINSNNKQARLLLEKVNRWDKQVRAEQAQRAKQTQRKVNKEPQKTPTKKAQPPASNKTPQKKSQSGFMAVLGIIAVLAVSFYCCVSSPLSSPSGTNSPASRPDPRNDLDISDVNYRRDGIGNLIITGEIENNSNRTWCFVQVSASGYDANGDLVDTGWTYADMERIRPGDVSPFTIYIDEEGRGIVNYKVQIIDGDPE